MDPIVLFLKEYILPKGKSEVDKVRRKNIVTRFGILHTLISNNGLQFDSKASKGTVVTWELQTSIPPRLIHRGLDRSRLSIRL